MIQAILKYVDHTERVAKAARRATYRAVEKTAFAIRKTAVDSIVRGEVVGGRTTTAGTKRDASGRFLKGSGKKSRSAAKLLPSRPGTPPHTRFGQLKKSIVYASRRGVAVIGPRASIIGESGRAHEFGGEYKGERYPERPFMGPALNANLTRFGNSFAGSIGG